MARGAGGGDRPVLLVHGLGGSSLNWLGLMEELGSEAEFLAPDLPGFGASPPPRDGDYSPGGHARALAALVAAWQPAGRPVHLVGNSLGGAVCVQLAAHRPDLVASVLLVSPALPTARITRGNAHLPLVAVPGVGEELVRRYGGGSAVARVQATLDACFADPSRVPPEVRDLLVAEVEMRDGLTYAADAFLSSLRGLLKTFAQVGPRRPWHLVRRIPTPSLLAIYGEDDILVPPESAKRMARTGARVVTLPDCGHVAQMEHPAIVANLWRSLA